MAVSGQYRALTGLSVGKKQDTVCIGGWLGPGASRENSGRGKVFSSVAIRVPDRPTSSPFPTPKTPHWGFLRTKISTLLTTFSLHDQNLSIFEKVKPVALRDDKQVWKLNAVHSDVLFDSQGIIITQCNTQFLLWTHWGRGHLNYLNARYRGF